MHQGHHSNWSRGKAPAILINILMSTFLHAKVLVSYHIMQTHELLSCVELHGSVVWTDCTFPGTSNVMWIIFEKCWPKWWDVAACMNLLCSYTSREYVHTYMHGVYNMRIITCMPLPLAEMKPSTVVVYSLPANFSFSVFFPRIMGTASSSS